jgi:flagellar secretion chaperone FliS
MTNMTTHARDEYLVTEVSTAPPQKLQLLLIEGAIRFALQTKECWRAQRDAEAAAAILRCQEIITEILAAVKSDVDRELAGRVAAIYAYLLRTLVAADRARDEKHLDQALAVLEIERETWQLVCQQLGTQAAARPHFQLPSPGGFCFEA